VCHIGIAESDYGRHLCQRSLLRHVARRRGWRPRSYCSQRCGPRMSLRTSLEVPVNLKRPA
jgi:hypothetical protein